MSDSRDDLHTAPVLRAGRVSATGLLVVGLAAFGVMLWAFRADPRRAFHSYLTAYTFVLTAALGSVGFLMIAHSANATWPVAVRRLPEAVMPALPLLSLLFVPILFGVHELYPWAEPGRFAPRVRELLEHRRAFMNPNFFGARAELYLVFWSVVALLLRHFSLAMEGGRDSERFSRWMRRMSYACLPFVALTVALTGFEWVMSLSPEYSSTMFGPLWVAICLFGGQASIVVLTGITQRSPLQLRAASPSHYSALGRLLFAFLIFLGYTMFFQYLLVWIGNKPSEAAWFVARGKGVYFWTTMFLIFGHFGVTFFLLLSYGLKRRIEPLTAVGVWALISQYIHIHWLITPASREPGFSWLDPVALIAVVCLTAALCLWLQRGKPLAATYDPRYVATLAYQSR